MSEEFLNPFIPVDLINGIPGKGMDFLEIELLSAPEKPSPGLPGKQTGDLLVIKESDQKKIQVSLGKKEKITLDTFRQAGGSLGKWLRQSGAENAGFNADSLSRFDLPGTLGAFLEGVLFGSYSFSLHKKKETNLPNVTLYIFGSSDNLAEVINRTKIVAKAVYLARDWSHEPANVINPATLAERVSALASEKGLKCTVIAASELETMGAGAIVTVGKGSKTPSRLILLEYKGDSTGTALKPVVLIGKALTFDSGGYSIKSTESIQGMKYDKCGGVTVAATLMAAAELKLKVHLIGVIAAAENMISSEAYRPDDILTTLSGKTVEIISTDAEGRLVLADAITYAQSQFQPRSMIDLATLTGGVVVALGRIRAGMMANNDELSNRLFTAGEVTHERLWRLPLDEDYEKLIKGDDADLKNSGGREGHAIIGGSFLKQFVDPAIPWAHLDIAGVADLPKETPYAPKGATGFGIRLLLNYLENL